MICKHAKKGLTPSQIGLQLRDSNGIAQIRSVTGSKIVRILKANGMIAFNIIPFHYLGFCSPMSAFLFYRPNGSPCSF